MAGTSLRFDISAVDRASAAFDRLGDRIEAVAVRLRALDSMRAEPKVKVDVDQGGLAVVERRLRALPNRVSTRVTVALTGAAGVLAQFAALQSAANALDGRTIRINLDVRGLAGAVAQLALLRSVLTALGSFGGGGGGPGGGIGLVGLLRGAAGMAAALAVMLVKAAAGAALLAAAGAAITAAFGGVSTAIFAAVGAIPLLAAGIGAVALGADGVKRAAASIRPEFDALRASVSATFERGLTPVFERLASTFPRLTTGLNGTATAIVGIASRLAELIATESGLTRLDTIFRNVNLTLTGMGPGLVALVDAIGMLAEQPAVFTVLSAAVHTFGTEFRESVVDLISDGTLNRALVGLQGTLRTVTSGLIELVENGIRAFSTAAPGFNAFIDSIFNLLNRFDWERLGGAAGTALQGIADAINSIPDSTIENITLAFEKLGDAFKDPAVQQGIRDFADSIPIVIDGIRQLVSVAGGAATALGGMANVVQGVQKVLSGDWSGFDQIAKGLEDIKRGTANAFPINVSLVDHGAQEQLGRIASLMATLPAGAKTITVDVLAPGAIATLESLGVKIEALPDGKGFRLTVEDDQVQARLNEYMSRNPPPIKVPIEPDTSKMDSWFERGVPGKPISFQLDLDTGPFDSKLADARARAGQALPIPQLNVDPTPGLTQVAAVHTAILGLNALHTTAQHTQVHNIPVVAAAINTLNSQNTTAPHVQTHNVPDVVAAINRLSSAHTSSTHTVSHNVSSVISAINSLNGRNTSSTHTITTVHRTVGAPSVRAAGGAIVRAAGGAVARFARGGILPGYAPGVDSIPALLSPGESVLTPEATRLLGAKAIRGLNAMSGRRGAVVGSGRMPGTGAGPRGGGGGGAAFGMDAAGVERKVGELIGKVDELTTVMRARDGVTVNVTGSPVGDPAETAQATKLALRTL